MPTHERAGFPAVRLGLALLLLELATIAWLPPWEGSDETAHYSYVQELADTRRIPVLGVSRMSRDVEAYARVAPMPYAATAPMENNGGITYRAFFAAGRRVVASGDAAVHGRPSRPRAHVPGLEPNWEAQHPPLYYALLAPLYRLTVGWSWARQLLLLRGVSCLLAWLGWCLAVAAARLLAQDRSWRTLGVAALVGLGLWPWLLPAWFNDVARLGNDSLCVPIVAGVALVSVRGLIRGLSLVHATALGVLLGLGTLTKVFMLPFAAGVIGFWAVRAIARRERTVGLHVAVMAALAFAIALPWMLRSVHLYGRAVVSATDVLERGRPHETVVSFATFARNVVAMIASAAWTPTWSLARPSEPWFTPFVFAIVLASITYLAVLRRRSLVEPAALPLWVAVPVIAGLLTSLVAKSQAGIPRGVGGYYLQLLMPVLAWALGLAVIATWHHRGMRRLWNALLAYAIAFTIVVQWEQLMLFAGIAFKAGAAKVYRFGPLPVALGIPTALHRLVALAYPQAGLVLWLAGEALAISGLVALVRHVGVVVEEVDARG